MTVPRLIEVALPIREISAESVRDKSLRHGHLSTLHLWFARRPLAASRAVVFASLVPDPDHPQCPPAFRAAVEKHLKTHVPDVLKSYRRGRVTHMDPDPYRPYDDQPDTLRNRLMMFIAKWSPEWLAFDTGKSDKEPKPENLLDDRSLVKWETSGPTTKIGTKEVPNEVGQKILWIARELTRIANGNQIPTVLDPFSGGGAIPLEAGRLGAQPIANDYNPVAYLILRATCEFPQKYGRPGQRPRSGGSGKRGLFNDGDNVEVPNILAFDVKYYAEEILRRAKEKLQHLYPAGKDKHPVVGYLWTRTVPCSNPSCKGEIPLIRSLLICDLRNRSKKVALVPHVSGKSITFSIARNEEIKSTAGTKPERGAAKCPFCNQPTSEAQLRQSGMAGQIGERMVAVIIETSTGKDYRPVEPSDLAAFAEAQRLASSFPAMTEILVPEINGPDAPEDSGPHASIRPDLYGMKQIRCLFNHRQFASLHTIVNILHDVLHEISTKSSDSGYFDALAICLTLAVDRYVQRMSSFGVWHTGQETFEHVFGRQSIPMIWDYPEANPFSTAAQKVMSPDYMLGVLEHEAQPNGSRPASVMCCDAAALPKMDRPVDAVVTDPPYFDAIGYADLTDYFYVWLKRSVGDKYPDVFATPQTPKSAEVVAHKHRHHGDKDAGEAFFQEALRRCLKRSHELCKGDGVISVMFAHQSTKAWTALINAVLSSGLNITGTWAIDTEKTYALKSEKSVLASSITVVCRPRVVTTPGSFKDVRRDIERVVRESVKRFWDYGFRGADLIVACYGPAVGEFGKYKRVERGDGQPVTVPELLQLVREAALKAIAGEFTGDQLSRLYFVWANMYGVEEQTWDDVRLVVQVGGDAENAMDVARGRGLFVVDGSTSRLAVLADRADRAHLGKDTTDPLIDQLHKAMLLWKAEDRAGLVQYLHGHDLGDHVGFWRLAQALFEVMPRDAEDWKLVSALLGERNTLRTEIKRREAALARSNASLFDE